MPPINRQVVPTYHMQGELTRASWYNIATISCLQEFSRACVLLVPRCGWVTSTKAKRCNMLFLEMKDSYRNFHVTCLVSLLRVKISWCSLDVYCILQSLKGYTVSVIPPNFQLAPHTFTLQPSEALYTIWLVNALSNSKFTCKLLSTNITTQFLWSQYIHSHVLYITILLPNCIKLWIENNVTG